MFGLLERDIQYVRKALDSIPSVEKAVIFGSRAMGNYKKGSDIDLAVKGSNITNRDIQQLDDLLNEVHPIPYFFDIIHYEQIQNEKLKKHIDKEGKSVPSLRGI